MLSYWTVLHSAEKSISGLDVGNSQRLLNRLQRLGQAADELRRDASHFTRALLDHLQLWFKTAKNTIKDQTTNKVRVVGTVESDRYPEVPLSSQGQADSTIPSAAVTALKEELSRKSKLLAAIKAARVADGNALEQWKSESRKLDDNCKRFPIMILVFSYCKRFPPAPLFLFHPGFSGPWKRRKIS